MGESAGAVAVGGHGLIVDVVHWDIVLVAFFVDVCLFSLPSRERGRLTVGLGGRGENVQNGPKLASGKPERLTLKSTPVPFALLVPET